MSPSLSNSRLSPWKVKRVLSIPTLALLSLGVLAPGCEATRGLEKSGGEGGVMGVVVVGRGRGCYARVFCRITLESQRF